MTIKIKPGETVVVKGRRFVLVAEDELRRLARLAKRAESPMQNAAALPPPDERGNRPAAEFVQASIARTIFAERTELELSQQELARLAGVRQETVCRLESGKHSPTVRTVERIELALSSYRRKRKK